MIFSKYFSIFIFYYLVIAVVNSIYSLPLLANNLTIPSHNIISIIPPSFFIEYQINSFLLGSLFIFLILNIIFYIVEDYQRKYLFFLCITFILFIKWSIFNTALLQIISIPIQFINQINNILICCLLSLVIGYTGYAYLNIKKNTFYYLYTIIIIVIIISLLIVKITDLNFYLMVRFSLATLWGSLAIIGAYNGRQGAKFDIFLFSIYLYNFISTYIFNVSFFITNTGIIWITYYTHNITMFIRFAIRLNQNAYLIKNLSKFLTKKILPILHKKEWYEVQPGHHINKEMTVMAVDIRNFTSLSEKMSSAETFIFLNDYLSLVSPIIFKNHGIIDKYIGDGITAFFEKKPQYAINTAFQLLKVVEQLNETKWKDKYPNIKIGIGIHYDSTTIGIIGYTNRMNLNLSGIAFEVALLAEQKTKEHSCSIIITDSVLKNLHNTHIYNIEEINPIHNQYPLYKISLKHE